MKQMKQVNHTKQTKQTKTKEQEAEECYEEIQHLSNYNNESENEESVGISGNSWLSNQTIITSLPNEKIRQSITYYKQIINLLEEELRDRVIGRRSHIEYVIPSFSTYKPIPKLQKTKYILRTLRPRLKYISKKRGKMAASLVENTWRKILEIYFEENP